MAIYTLPYFGEFDTDNIEEYYDVSIPVNGHEVSVDLNFMNNKTDPDALRLVESFINNLSEYEKKSRKYIADDYADENSEAVRDYVDHHIEEFAPEELSAVIDYNNKTIKPELQLITALKLVRVGLYPYDKEEFAIFDYSFNKDLTQYLVVVCTDHNGNLERIAMES